MKRYHCYALLVAMVTCSVVGIDDESMPRYVDFNQDLPNLPRYVNFDDLNNELTRSMNFVKNVAIGSGAGISEVLLDQPLICMKNRLQQGKSITLDPKILYRGFGVNVACMGPSTAAQIGINETLKDLFPGDDLKTALLRSGAAGGLSVFFSSPIEMTVLHQQNTGHSASQVFKDLVAQEGKGVMLRGIGAQGCRDIVFTCGLLTGFSKSKKAIRQHVIDNEFIAMVLSSLTVGGVTALASHPADTVATFERADYKKEKAKNTRQAVEYLYKEGGLMRFYRGFWPRWGRIGLAIPVMNKGDEYIRHGMDRMLRWIGYNVAQK